MHANKGPTGEPNPFGNRAYRRSKEGKAEIERKMIMLRELLGEDMLGDDSDLR